MRRMSLKSTCCVSAAGSVEVRFSGGLMTQTVQLVLLPVSPPLIGVTPLLVAAGVPALALASVVVPVVLPVVVLPVVVPPVVLELLDDEVVDGVAVIGVRQPLRSA